MMDNMFRKADGSGRSVFCFCGSYLDTASISASGCCCSAKLGMICGYRFLVPSLLHGTLATVTGGMPRGEDVDRMTWGDDSKWQREHEGSQVKLADEILVAREEQDSHYRDSADEECIQTGGGPTRGFELCLCPG